MWLIAVSSELHAPSALYHLTVTHEDGAQFPLTHNSRSRLEKKEKNFLHCISLSV